MTKETRDLIVGLDIGTSKIVALVAELTAEGTLSVLGMGSQDSSGLKKGVVINIEKTVESISRAVAEAEMMSGCKIKEVYTGIAGSHIKSKDSNGMAVVRDKEVTQFDVERAMEAAKATPISNDDQILHVIPQEFIVDGQDGVKEPIGMDARRLEVNVHIVTGAVTAVQNIVKCVHRCGLEVVDLVLQPLASGHAVLSEDERNVGVCLVDIGGGTTDMAVFSQGAIRHTAVIPIAGDLMTNDISIALRTSTQDAEEIKIRYGVALQQLADAEDMIEVPGVGDRPSSRLSRQALAGFIQRSVGDGRHDRARRGDLPQHGQARHAPLLGQPEGHRAQSALLDGGGAAGRRHGATQARHQGARPQIVQAGPGADARLVREEFLKMRFSAASAGTRNSAPRRICPGVGGAEPLC